jgi:hypothetical protein
MRYLEMLIQSSIYSNQEAVRDIPTEYYKGTKDI